MSIISSLTKVKIGDYEFVRNPTDQNRSSVSLQNVSKGLDGAAQISFVPESEIETDKIKRKQTIQLTGVDPDIDQIEAIEAELIKKPPIYFRDFLGREYSVYVKSFITEGMTASDWVERKWGFTVEEM